MSFKALLNPKFRIIIETVLTGRMLFTDYDFSFPASYSTSRLPLCHLERNPFLLTLPRTKWILRLEHVADINRFPARISRRLTTCGLGSLPQIVRFPASSARPHHPFKYSCFSHNPTPCFHFIPEYLSSFSIQHSLLS